jgi:hypothetical protein
MPGESLIPMLSELESGALVEVAGSVVFLSRSTGEEPYFAPGASEEDRRKAEEEDRKRKAERETKRKEALDQFVNAVNERLAGAYNAGANAAIDRADRNNFNARSVTLYLVVLAVVAMPAIAMIINLNPQTFGSYIAPVTGIAGTVVGYWFGTLSRPGKYSENNR